MSINETEYKMDIEGLQRALERLPPQSFLTITSREVTLTESYRGELSSESLGSRAVAKNLAAAAEQFNEE
jgi:hypothetical protein